MTPSRVPDAPGPLTEAAVLVPLTEGARGPSLVFIVRTDHGPHAGQVAFPGGRRDDRDASPQDTALRELEEELGVPRAAVTVTGSLEPMDTWSSGYRVTPVVGRLSAAPAWRPDPREVKAVLEIPLAALRDPANRGETERMGHRLPCLTVDGHVIWGLTYRILERLLPRLAGEVGPSSGGEAAPPPRPRSGP